MYGYEHWTIKKDERRWIGAFELQFCVPDPGKDRDPGKDWRQEEKGTPEDEMVGWHHWLDGQQFGQVSGVGDGHGGLMCCSPRGHRESDTTEKLNWTELNELDVMILVFWILSFKPAFSLSSFTFIKRLFSSSLLPAIRVVSSVYLRLLIFLLTIWIPACASSSLVFHMMYSTYKLNKQGDNIQPWHSSFPVWNQSVVPCPVLTVACDLHTDFSGDRSGGLLFPSL